MSTNHIPSSLSSVEPSIGTVHSNVQALTVTFTDTLEYVELEPGLAVYRIQRVPNVSEEVAACFASVLAPYRAEGFASVEALRLYEKGECQKVERLERNGGTLHLLPSGAQAWFQELGFSEALERAEKERGGWWCSKTPYEDIVLKGVSLDNALYVDGTSHLVFDRQGVILPHARKLDYIEAGLHNENYDLEKAAAILSQDSRVKFLDGWGRPLEAGRSPILPIPSYNAEGGRSSYLFVHFMPTQEDAIRMWEAQQSYGTKYPSTEWRRAILDLDILGLVEGGARRPPLAE